MINKRSAYSRNNYEKDIINASRRMYTNLLDRGGYSANEKPDNVDADVSRLAVLCLLEAALTGYIRKYVDNRPDGPIRAAEGDRRDYFLQADEAGRARVLFGNPLPLLIDEASECMFDKDVHLDKTSASDSGWKMSPSIFSLIHESLLSFQMRRTRGVYYTPAMVVEYMVGEALAGFISGILEDGAIRPRLEKRIIALRKGGNSRHGEPADPKLLPGASKSDRAEVEEALSRVKILDPAVGGGAFLVEAMKKIELIRTALSERADMTGSDRLRRRIDTIENSLYGIDPDPVAVRICRISLWLTAIEGTFWLRGDSSCRDLKFNILNGDSLLGMKRPNSECENSPDNRSDSEEMIRGIIDNHGGFDIIIANPPYLGERGNKELFQKIASGPLGKYYRRHMDLFYFFIHRALDLARPNGRVSFLTSNYYPTATGADKLRDDLRNRAIIEKLINFNELRLFDSASGHHNMITIMRRGYDPVTSARTAVTSRLGRADDRVLKKILSGTDRQTEYREVTQIDLFDTQANYIRLTGSAFAGDGTVDRILKKMRLSSVSLGDICNVNQGIVTGADRVTKRHIERYRTGDSPGDGIFVLSVEELMKKGISLDSRYVKPWFKNSSISKYVTEQSTGNYVLYLKDNKSPLPVEPEIQRHFEPFRQLLIDRLSVCRKNRIQWNIVSRWIDRGEYYLLFYPRKPEIFESPKIVAPQRCRGNVFGYNEIPWYASADVYFITARDKNVNLKYILALLNSRLLYLWLYHRGKRKGEALELYQKPLSEIPIPAACNNVQKTLAKKVDELRSLSNGSRCRGTDKRRDEYANINDDIDRLILGLFDLSMREIDSIRGLPIPGFKRNSMILRKSADAF